LPFCFGPSEIRETHALLSPFTFTHTYKVLTITFFFQNYKPPGAKDIPIDFRVELRKNAPNPFGVLRSKGETHLF
jgi:hypothetical protein